MTDTKGYFAIGQNIIDSYRDMLADNPTREQLRASLDLTLGLLTGAVMTKEGEERDTAILKAPYMAIIIASCVDVMCNSPLYGSRALVLQWEHAVQARMDKYHRIITEGVAQKEKQS